MKHKKKKTKSKKELGLSDNSVKILKNKKKSKHKIKHSSSKEKKDASAKKKNKQHFVKGIFQNEDLNVDINNISSEVSAACQGTSKNTSGSAKHLKSTLKTKSKTFDLNSSNSSLPQFSNDITKLATSTPRLTQQHKNIAPDIGIAETSKGMLSQQRTKLDEIRCGLESRLDKNTSDVLMAQVSALLSMTPQSQMSHKKKKSKKLKKHKKGKHDSKDKPRKSKKKGDSHKQNKHKETTLLSEGILKEPLTNLPPLIVQGMSGRSPSVAATTTSSEIKLKQNVGTSRKSSNVQINQLINSLPAKAHTNQRTDIVNNQQGKSTKTDAMGASQQPFVNKPSVNQKELEKVVGRQKKTRNLSCSFDDESELDVIPPKNFKKIIKEIDQTTLPDLNSVVRKGIEDDDNHITNALGENVVLRHSEVISVSGKDAGLVTSVMHVKKNNMEVLGVIENSSESILHHDKNGDAGVKNMEQELIKMPDGTKNERKKKHKKLKKKTKKRKSDGKHKKSKHKKSIKKNHNEKKSELKKKENSVVGEVQSNCFNKTQHMNATDINIDLHLTEPYSNHTNDVGKQTRSLLMMVDDVNGGDDDNRNNLNEMLANAEGGVSETISTGKDLYELNFNENKTFSRRALSGTNERIYDATYCESTINLPKISVDQTSDLKGKNMHKRKKKKSKENIASNDKVDCEFINYSDFLMKKVSHKKSNQEPKSNLSTVDQDSNDLKETELKKSTKNKKKNQVYEENVCDPLSQNLYVKFTKAVDETLVSEESNGITNVHHKKKTKEDRKKPKTMDEHILEIPEIGDNINENYLSAVEEMDEKLVGKKHKRKKHKKRHSGEGNLEPLEELKSSTSTGIEVFQELEKKRKADDATDITETQTVKRKKTKSSSKKIMNIVSDSKTGREPQIIAVSANGHGNIEKNQCDGGGISVDDNEDAAKKLVLLQNKKKKSKKSKKDLFENSAEENIGDQLETFEGEAPAKMNCEIEEGVTCISKKKHKRSNECIHEKEDTMTRSNIEDSLVSCSGDASGNKSFDVSEEAPSVTKRKKKHKKSSEFIHSKEDEIKTESSNTLKDHIVTCGEQDVSSDRNCEISKENKSKKEKKLKGSVENNQEQESNTSTGISEMIEDHQPTFEGGEVSADKSCEQTKPEESASMSRKKKKKHKRSIEMSPPDNIEVKTGFYDTHGHLVLYEEEELLENKDSEVAVDETSSRKRKHKKHKRSIEVNTENENKGETESHNVAEEQVVTLERKKLLENNGDIAEQTSFLKKKKKRKRSINNSEGIEQEVKIGSHDIAEHLVSFREEKVIEDKKGELAEEENTLLKKRKKKKRKRSIDISQEDDDDEVKSERHNNNIEEHLVSFRGEKVLEENRGGLAEEEITLSKKRKKKKHKQSTDKSQEGENEIKIESQNKNDEKHFVNLREEELLEDQGGEFAEEEISLLKIKKKKKRKHKKSTDNQLHLSACELQAIPESMSGEIVDEGTDVSVNKNISNNIIDKAAQEDKTYNKKRKMKRSKELYREPVMDRKTSSSDSRPENEQNHNDYENEEVLRGGPSNYRDTHKEKHKEDWRELKESEHDYKEKKMLISKDNSDKILCENTEEILDDISVGSKCELVIDETLSSGENDITIDGVKSDKIDSDETCIDGEIPNKAAEAVNICNVSHQSDYAEVWEDSVGDEETIDDNIVIMELASSSHVAPKLLTDNDEQFLQKWKFTSRGFPKNANAWRNLTAPLPHSWKYESHMNDEENLQENTIKSFYNYYWKNNPDLLNKKHKKSLNSSIVEDSIMSDSSKENEDSDESAKN
ncbi:titin homolog [Anneissia japonica]|uniref:titin homolog n=1 Tax=Anneissia japonica TaxID=1529436 RepID=UPI00142563B4|nr:titin homolog [Anneissia japonica]XP_033101000.1 titin homolog [Anneissia japonica]